MIKRCSGNKANTQIEPHQCTYKERILIASLPIRNARKPSALNRISISNRQKKGIFRTTRHLQYETCHLPF
jgi:hypothetical protein